MRHRLPIPHGVVRGSGFWRHQLAFRDYLRSHVETASAYGLLKRHLAFTHAGDRRGYRAVGLDVSATFLREARRAIPSAKAPLLVRARIRGLPFTESFDTVIITATPLSWSASTGTN